MWGGVAWFGPYTDLPMDADAVVRGPDVPSALPAGWQVLPENEVAIWGLRLRRPTTVMPWLVAEQLRPVAYRAEGESALLCYAGSVARVWYVLRYPRDGGCLVPEFSGDWAGFVAAETIYVVDEE